jgi:hypothetical protein
LELKKKKQKETKKTPKKWGKMGKTITEKAVDAINELNKAALIMARQMKSGELDAATGDKAYLSAVGKLKAWSKSYFSNFGDGAQIAEFEREGLEQEIETANERFGKVLKHYAKAVGAEFVQ